MLLFYMFFCYLKKYIKYCKPRFSVGVTRNYLDIMLQEKRFVTGQNQNSSHDTAQLMMQTLTQKGL